MATSNYDQNNTAQVSTLLAYCGPSSTAGVHNGNQAEIGVGLGNVPFSGTVDQSVSDETELSFECIIPTDVSDPSDTDTATININFTTGHMDITLESVTLCRVDSSSVNQETIGSSSGLGLLTTVGVVSPTVSCSGVTFAAGDVCIVTLGFSNASSMFSRAIAITPDQVLALPFNSSAGALPVPLAFDHLAMGHH